MKSLLLVTCSWFIAFVSALWAAPPPELVIVQQQYETAVMAPYAAAKAELDTKFIAALTKAASTAMEAGELDKVLAIQADQKCLTEKLPIPDDDTQLPEALTKLRSIYRAQLARVEAQRVANHTAFLPGYTSKLKDLEIYLTKATRIADASEVKTYRESLLAAPVTVPATVAKTPPGTPSSPEKTVKTSYPKGDDRKAAEWVLSVGGSMVIQESGKPQSTVNSVAGMPKGKFQLLEITLDGKNTTGPVTGEGLKALTGLENLKSFTIANLEPGDDDLSFIGTFPNLTVLKILKNSQFTGTALKHLADCKELLGLDFSQSPITDACIPHLNKVSKLNRLEIANTKITPEGLAQLTAKLQTVGFNVTPGESLKPVVAALAPKQPQVTRVSLAYDIADDTLSLLKDFPKLTTIDLNGSATESLLDGLDGVPDLVTFIAGPYFPITDAGLMKFVPMKKLKKLSFKSPNLTDAGVAAFKKARRDVALERR